MQMEAALHTVCVSKCPLPPHTPPASRCGLINVQCESWEKPEQAEVSGASSGREWRLCFPRVWADSIRCCHSSRDVNTLLYSSNCAGHSAKMKHLNNSKMILELMCGFSSSWIHQICRKARVNVVVFSSLPTATDSDLHTEEAAGGCETHDPVNGRKCRHD